jgi:ATPase subunit of ABC transporter with duplicated ATPase domains
MTKGIWLRLDDAAFAWRGDRDLFGWEGARAHLTEGCYGLVGGNGAGKSTLLRLMAGELTPDHGGVRLGPKVEVRALCRQEVEAPGDDAWALAGRWDADAMRWRDRLELEPGGLYRWDELSPGMRKRWQLAGALAREPDVLLLDEPTNHLDPRGRDALMDTLRARAGITVIVSHDRALLDEATARTLWLEGGALREYPCGCSEAMRLRDAERERAIAERDALRARRDAMREDLQAARERREGAESNVSVRARSNGPKDTDARSVAARGRVMNALAAHSRSEGVARGDLARVERELEGARVGKRPGSQVFARGGSAPMRTLCALVGVDVTPAPGAPVVLPEVTAGVDRDARVLLEGPNGAGKTSLLRALRAHASIPDERVLWLPQTLSPERVAREHAALGALGNDALGDVLHVAAALGASPDRLRAGGPLSPGEAKKLCLARALAQDVWLVLLDEPTNHLDLPSIARLQDALLGYEGAQVVVTHDLRLRDALGERAQRWQVANGEVTVQAAAP